LDPIIELERIHGDAGDWRGIYTIGLQSKSRYLTIKSQQRRAVELVRRLDKLRPASDNTTARIVILGAGFAGLTLASSLAQTEFGRKGSRRKWDITVFESQNQLVPMQRGCTIRKLHPSIHRWPDLQCFSNVGVRQSLLGWESGDAGEVAAGFVDKIFANYRFAESRSYMSFRIYQSASLQVHEATPAPDYRVIGTAKYVHPSDGRLEPAAGKWHADVVVFATGFGAEIFTDQNVRRESYWRNDDLGQAPLYGEKQRFVVSGAGDGGLTDLFRLCLYDFSYDTLVQEVLPVQPSEIQRCLWASYSLVHPKAVQAVTKNLTTLRQQYAKMLVAISQQGDDPLFDILEGVWNARVVADEGQCLGILARANLEGRIKRDVEVTLQLLPDINFGLAGIERIVNNNNAMLYNRVLAYLLWKLGAFEVVEEEDVDSVARAKQWAQGSYRRIVRRGADWRDGVFSCLSGTLQGSVLAQLTVKDSPPPSSEIIDQYRLGDL
jgi:hypothetical protein